MVAFMCFYFVMEHKQIYLLIMKSTLPALFRIPSKQKQHQQPTSPQKQTPYYNLHLTLSHNYRTKIINPIHKKSMGEQKLPSKSKLKFKQRYQEYPSRSLSVQKDYDNNTSISMMSTIEGYPSKSVNNLEEIDNVRINVRKVHQDLVLLATAMGDVPLMHQNLKEEIKGLKVGCFQRIESLENEYKGKIEKLWEMLSSLRRQTNMEIKSMKREADLIGQQIQQQVTLIKDIENQRLTIKQINF